MTTKFLEIRDKATFIPALAVEMTPGGVIGKSGPEFDEVVKAWEGRRYLLRRCGYDFRFPAILLTRLSGKGYANADPCYWGDRTWTIAHSWITEHWSELKDGDVVDVEFLLGEASAPKVSERETVPL